MTIPHRAIHPPESPGGLRTFSFHAQRDAECRRRVRAIHPGRHLWMGGETSPARTLHPLAPEAAARLWFDALLSSDEHPEVAATSVSGHEPGFRCLAVESTPDGRRWAVLFRQRYAGVEVFGSLVTVELTRTNALVSVSGALGEPANVDPFARLSPFDARRALAGIAEVDPRSPAEVPALHYFFDSLARRWRLAYLFRDVAAPDSPEAGAGVTCDVLIDAHFGDLVESLPRQAGLHENALDDRGETRRIGVEERAPGRLVLNDPELRIETRDLGFQNFRLGKKGKRVERRTDDEWDPVAVGAHANASDLARFLQRLGWAGRDGSGSPFVQLIRCVPRSGLREWAQAAWDGKRVLYGQVEVPGVGLRSFARDPDVVAHELFHAVISAKPRMSLKGETGALNESYCDLLAVAVANLERAGIEDPRQWRWTVGADEGIPDQPVRDLADPDRTGHPSHVDQVADPELADLEDGTHGGVHAHSVVHSHAVHRLFIAENDDGTLAFDPRLLVRLLFQSIVAHATKDFVFADSRHALELLALSELPNEELRTAALDRIAESFDAVGIAGT